ncbi:hypothetical protein [Paenibacillus sp. y28]
MQSLALASKMNWEDIGQAMLLIIVIVGSFFAIILWAKWKNRKRKQR